MKMHLMDMLGQTLLMLAWGLLFTWLLTQFWLFTPSITMAPHTVTVHHSGVVFTFSKSIHDAISESAKHPDFTPWAVFTCAAVDHDENFQADDPMDDSHYVYSEVNEVEDPWNVIQ